MRKILIVVLVLALLSAAAFFFFYRRTTKPAPTRREAFGKVTPFAGTGAPGNLDGAANDASFRDSFGVAVDSHGNVIIADGETNHLRLITPQGEVKTIAGSGEGYADGPALEAQFNTPSALAFDRAGNLLIADTSNNRIRKLSADYLTVTTVAGSGVQGLKDGAASEAQFDAPVGLVVDAQSNIYVADTYNDCIRKITPDDQVITLAGIGIPGFQDGNATTAMFDTPCGLAVDEQSNVYVADTANRAVRKITPTGEVSTLAQSPEHRGDGDGLDTARLGQPMALALTHDGFLFIADAGSQRVVRIAPDGQKSLYAMNARGYIDDASMYLDTPSGMALDRTGNLFVSDPQNYLVRKIIPFIPPATPPAENNNQSANNQPFIQPPTETIPSHPENIIPKLTASTLNVTQPFPWPVSPQNQWHEVAGTVGEARGNFNGTALDHIHAGLDVHGEMGEPCLSVYDEKVTSPLASRNFDESGEHVHLNAFTYVHIRVGRNAKGELQSPIKFKARLDPSGKLIGVRVRRGARFRVGDVIGTLNRLYHVHLNLGPWNAVANPMQLPFVGFKDTVAPIIEPKGIEVVKTNADIHQPYEAFTEKRAGRLVVSGDVKILLTAYDRVEGNIASRKLGLYRAGYQLFKEDGSPVAGFEQPLINIEFNRLPPDDDGVALTYATGSGISAYGTPTKFRYILTDRIRDGEARDGFLRTSLLTPGNYLIRITAEDYMGNRATGPATELPITIEAK